MAELKSNAEWKRWGKDDPLWGVASWAGREKDEATPWTEEEFYALGESDWRDFQMHWVQYGVSTKNCLEIGCGAGRLTKQLAGFFDHVCAVDVSENMVGRAQKAVAPKIVEFSIIDGLHLPQDDGSVSAVFSTHVLQHLDSEELGHSYFREMFRVLDVNGTIMVHLPLYEFPRNSGIIGALMRSQLTAIRTLSNIKASMNRSLGTKIMRYTQYRITALNLILSDIGFKQVEYRVFSLKSNGAPHPFVFAAK
jgi:ubiquinone/menaquinone biosynthesis C-methylase UbiE